MTTDGEVRMAFAEIRKNGRKQCPHAEISDISVQQMLPEGVEVIVGVTNDPTFGSVIMLGLGGVFVEVFKDVSFRVAPINKNDAFKMMEELKGYEILQGVRGQPELDKEAIVDVLLKVSALITDHGEKIRSEERRVGKEGRDQ